MLFTGHLAVSIPDEWCWIMQRFFHIFFTGGIAYVQLHPLTIRLGVLALTATVLMLSPALASDKAVNAIAGEKHCEKPCKKQ